MKKKYNSKNNILDGNPLLPTPKKNNSVYNKRYCAIVKNTVLNAYLTVLKVG